MSAPATLRGARASRARGSSRGSSRSKETRNGASTKQGGRTTTTTSSRGKPSTSSSRLDAESARNISRSWRSPAPNQAQLKSAILDHAGNAFHSSQGWRDAAKTDGPTYKRRMNDLYQTLKENREKERKKAIKDGILADPEKPTLLANAITPVGTCQDMCPEFERVERIVQLMVDANEKIPSSANAETKVPSEALMVKRFRRSAAGYDEQLPSDIRPPAILQKTLDHLLDIVVGGPEPLANTHKFVWDRTRGIRNDFSIQQVTKVEDLRIAIDCFERIARFHILSLHLLSRPDADNGEFDHFQEREQLNNTLLSLMYYYDDSRHKMASPNEAEFRAYCVIFEIQDQRPDLEDRAQNWPSHILKDPQTKTALNIYAAAGNTTDDQGPLRPRAPFTIAQANANGFFNLVKSNAVSYVMACVAEIYFNFVRGTTLEAIWKAYKGKRPGSAKVEDWTIPDLTDALGFDDDEQTWTFCEEHGFEIQEREDGENFLDLGSIANGSFEDTNPRRKQIFSRTHVEHKRFGRSLPAVINGLSVAEAQSQGLVSDSEVDNASIANSDSLFIDAMSDEDGDISGPKLDDHQELQIGMPDANLSKLNGDSQPAIPTFGLPSGQPTLFQPVQGQGTQNKSSPFASTSPNTANSPFVPKEPPKFNFYPNSNDKNFVPASTPDALNKAPPTFKISPPSETTKPAPFIWPAAPAPAHDQGAATQTTFGKATPPLQSAKSLFSDKNFPSKSDSNNPAKFVFGSPTSSYNTNTTATRRPEDDVNQQHASANPPKGLDSTAPSLATFQSPPVDQILHKPAPVPALVPATEASSRSSRTEKGMEAASSFSSHVEKNHLDDRASNTPSISQPSFPANNFNNPTPSSSTKTLHFESHPDRSSSEISKLFNKSNIDAPTNVTKNFPMQLTNPTHPSTSRTPPPTQFALSKTSQEAESVEINPPEIKQSSIDLPEDSAIVSARQQEAIKKIADALVFEEGGLIHQYIEITLGPIVEMAVRQFEDGKSWQKAQEMRRILLVRKYGNKWKRNSWKLGLLRRGRERRQNLARWMSKSTYEKQPKHSESLIDPFPDSASFDGKGSQPSSTLKANNTTLLSQRKSLPSDIAADLKQELAFQGGIKRKQVEDKETGDLSKVRRTAGHKRSNTVGDSIMHTPPHRISRQRHRSSIDISRLNKDSLLANTIMKQARRLAPSTKSDATRTDYFRLKALGLNPDTPTVPQTTKRTLNQSVMNGPGGDSAQSPQVSRISTTSAPGRGLSPSTKPDKAPVTDNDDEAFFASIRSIRETLADSTSWFQNERQSLERSMTPQTPPPLSRVPSTNPTAAAKERGETPAERRLREINERGHTPSRTEVRLRAMGDKAPLPKGFWEKSQRSVQNVHMNGTSEEEEEEGGEGDIFGTRRGFAALSRKPASGSAVNGYNNSEESKLQGTGASFEDAIEL